MLGIKRKISMALAAVMLIVSVGAVQVSSAAGTKSRQYIVYDFATQQEVTSAAYTLTLSEQYGTSTYGIIGSDDRVQYNNSGIVSFTHDAGKGGTGFIVGDHTIATAAHCIYNLGSSLYKSEFEITLYNASGTAVKTLTEENCTIQAHIPVWYKTPPTGQSYSNYDYALITVTEDLSSYEHFKLGEIIDGAESNSDIPVSVCGFPGEYSQSYIGTGALHELTDYRVKYYTDTTGGQSGSPVFISSTYTIVKNNSASSVSLKTVIGIHTNGYNEGDANPSNKAVRITPELRYFYLNNPYNTYED